jgi:hypothetical protein
MEMMGRISVPLLAVVGYKLRLGAVSVLFFLGCSSNRPHHFNRIERDCTCRTDSVVIRDFTVCDIDVYPLRVSRRAVDADSLFSHFLSTVRSTHEVYFDTIGHNHCDSSFFHANWRLRYRKFDRQRIRSMAGDESGVLFLVPIIHTTYSVRSGVAVSAAGGAGTWGSQSRFLDVNIFAFCNGMPVYYRSGYWSNFGDWPGEMPKVDEALWQRVVGEVMQDFTPGRLPGAEPWQGRKRKRK